MRPSRFLRILRHPVNCLHDALLSRSLLREQKALTRRLQAQSMRRVEDLGRQAGHRPRERDSRK